MRSSIIRENFSITSGGPFYRLESYLKLINANDRRVVTRAAVYAVISWVPLFLLAAFQRDFLAGGASSFLYDIPIHVRFLLAVPLLAAAENIVDDRFTIIAAYFPNSEIVKAEDRDRYLGVLARIKKLCESWISEVIILILAYSFSGALVYSDLTSGSAMWRIADGGGSLSPAGWWFFLVSNPLFCFLLFRWGWRWVIWCIYLWRLSRMQLQLTSTHPDLAGGLGILSESLYAFTPIIFANSAVLSAVWSKQVLFFGAHVVDYKGELIVFAVLFLFLAVGPLLIFTARLVTLKLRGLHDYGMLANRHSLYFDNKWIGQIEEQGEEVLGTPDVSSLADLGTGYQTVQKMLFLPFGWRNLVPLAVAAVAPMLPLIATEIPLLQLLKKVTGVFV